MKKLTILTMYEPLAEDGMTGFQPSVVSRYAFDRWQDITNLAVGMMDNPNAVIVEITVTDGVYTQILADPDFGAASILSEEDV